MRFEDRQRAQLLDRCWSVYLWLTQVFILPESFHVEFPATAESALITGNLHVTIPITEKLTLSLREEYATPLHMHDERGRVRSFTWQVQDFISYAKSSLTPTATE